MRQLAGRVLLIGLATEGVPEIDATLTVLESKPPPATESFADEKVIG